MKEENIPEDQPTAKRYRLRSGAVGDQPTDNVLKTATKSTEDKKKPKPKSGPKPFIDFKGTVEYYTDEADIEAACAKLL